MGDAHKLERIRSAIEPSFGTPSPVQPITRAKSASAADLQMSQAICPHCGQMKDMVLERRSATNQGQFLELVCNACETCFGDSQHRPDFVIWEGAAYCCKCHVNVVEDDKGRRFVTAQPQPFEADPQAHPVSWFTQRVKSLTRRIHGAGGIDPHLANKYHIQTDTFTIGERGGSVSSLTMDPNTAHTTITTPPASPPTTAMTDANNLLTLNNNTDDMPTINNNSTAPDGNYRNSKGDLGAAVRVRSVSLQAKNGDLALLQDTTTTNTAERPAPTLKKLRSKSHDSDSDIAAMQKMRTNESMDSAASDTTRRRGLSNFSLSNAVRSPNTRRKPKSPSSPQTTKRPSMPSLFRKGSGQRASKSSSEADIFAHRKSNGEEPNDQNANSKSNSTSNGNLRGEEAAKAGVARKVPKTISMGLQKIRRGSSTNVVANNKDPKAAAKKSIFKDDPNNIDIVDLQKNLGITVKKDMNNHGRNIRKAACYLVDAFSGRLQNGLGSTFDKPWYVRLAFRVHMSSIYKQGLKLLGLLLCLLVFWEPPSFQRCYEVSEDTATLCNSLELFLMVLLLLDYFLRILYMGWETMKSKPFILLLLYIELLCFADVIVALILGRRTIRVSRALRPAIFVLTDKNTLQLCKQCVSAERKLRTLALMLVFTVCVFSIGLSAVCSVEEWNQSEFHAEGIATNWTQEWTPFRTFPYSVTPVLAMLSGEGFPDVAIPWSQERGELTLLFYLLLIVGSMTLLNLAIAVQVDEFQRLQAKTTTSEEKKLMKTLAVVFYLVRDERTFRISKETFQLLMKAYKPRLKIGVVDMLFMTVDNNNTHDLDLSEFLDLCEHLRSSEMSRKLHYDQTISEAVIHYLGSAWETVCEAVDSRIHLLSPIQQLAFFQFVQSPRLVIASNVVILLNAISLACLPDAKSQPEFVHWILVADFVCFGLFVLEMLVHLYVNGRQRFWKVGWNRYQVTVSIAGILIFVFYPLSELYLKERLHISDPDLSIHKIACCMRMLRLFKGQKRFTVYINLAQKTWPVLLDFAKLILCFMYSHGVVCMEVLWRTRYYSSATNMAISQLWFLQVDGWQNAVYSMWEEVEYTIEKVLAAALVCSFIWYISIITLSQLMAVMYDIFKVYRNKVNAKPQSNNTKPSAADKPTRKGKASRTNLELASKQSHNWRRQMLAQDEGDKIKNELVDLVGYKSLARGETTDTTLQENYTKLPAPSMTTVAE